MAASNSPLGSATIPATKYLLSTDSREKVYNHACKLNDDIFEKKSQTTRCHAEREQSALYKAGLGSEMNMLCWKPKCWDPIVKRPRTLNDHTVLKHGEVVNFHCGPCGKVFKQSRHLDQHLQDEHGAISYCSMFHFTVEPRGVEKPTGKPYPVTSDGSCWCLGIQNKSQPWDEMVALGLLHPLPDVDTSREYRGVLVDGCAPCPKLRTRATRNENSYVFKSRGKKIITPSVAVSEDNILAIPSAQEDTLATVSDTSPVGQEDTLATVSDTSPVVQEDTLAIGG